MSTQTKTYNGWTNYETWNVALWFDNDQGMYSMRQEWAQAAWDDAEATKYSTRAEVAAQSFSDTIKDFVEENNPLSRDASMYSDLMNAALSEVNWYEIAENWLEEVDKAEETIEASEE